MPININPNILNEEGIDLLNEEIVIIEAFGKSDTEIEIYETTEELKFPQEYEDGGIVTLDDSSEKDLNNPRIQTIFHRSRHKNLSFFMVSQNYYELPNRTIRANGNIYHIFKPNNFRHVRNLYQDKAKLDVSLKEYKHSTSTCWDKNHQPFTIDTTKDKITGRCRLGLNSKLI